MSFKSVRERMNGDLMNQLSIEARNTKAQLLEKVESQRSINRSAQIKIKELEAQVKDLGAKLNDCAERNMKHKVSVMDLEAKLADISERAFKSEHDYKEKLQVAKNALIDARSWLDESNYPNACNGINEAIKKIEGEV